MPEALRRLTDALEQQGIRLFAVVDHAGAAREAGLELADEVVAIFGNPAAGTALMQQDPRVGLDLPLRMLFWSREGTTHLAYRSPSSLAETYDLGDVGPRLEKLDAVMRGLRTPRAGAEPRHPSHIAARRPAEWLARRLRPSRAPAQLADEPDEKARVDQPRVERVRNHRHDREQHSADAATGQHEADEARAESEGDEDEPDQHEAGHQRNADEHPEEDRRDQVEAGDQLQDRRQQVVGGVDAADRRRRHPPDARRADRPPARCPAPSGCAAGTAAAAKRRPAGAPRRGSPVRRASPCWMRRMPRS